MPHWLLLTVVIHYLNAALQIGVAAALGDHVHLAQVVSGDSDIRHLAIVPLFLRAAWMQ